MRNGTRSNKLTLVRDNDLLMLSKAEDLPPVQAVTASGSRHADTQPDSRTAASPILVLFSVSIACATAAVAAGSYALWLSRQKAARQTLTDVQDILKRCQDRMRQMENDLDQLPSSVTSVFN